MHVNGFFHVLLSSVLNSQRLVRKVGPDPFNGAFGKPWLATDMSRYYEACEVPNPKYVRCMIVLYSTVISDLSELMNPRDIRVEWF